MTCKEPIISYARKLRKDQTEAEKILWNLLRNRKLHGFKFRRQHPVSKLFILDFYCLEKNLAIEVDGNYHFKDSQKKLDEQRSDILKMFGIKILRFSNDQVLNQSYEVLKIILEALNDNLK